MALRENTNRARASLGGTEKPRALTDELLDGVAGGVGTSLPSPARSNIYIRPMEEGPGTNPGGQ